MYACMKLTDEDKKLEVPKSCSIKRRKCQHFERFMPPPFTVPKLATPLDVVSGFLLFGKGERVSRHQPPLIGPCFSG